MPRFNHSLLTQISVLHPCPFSYRSFSLALALIPTTDSWFDFMLPLPCQWDPCSFGILRKRRRMVVSYQPFGKICTSHLEKSSCPSSLLVRLDPWRWDRLVVMKGGYEITILYYFFWTAWPLNVGPIGCPERLVRHYHSTSTRPGEDVIWILWKWNVHCPWRNSPP